MQVNDEWGIVENKCISWRQQHPLWWSDFSCPKCCCCCPPSLHSPPWHAQALDPLHAHQRWVSHTRRFLEGMPYTAPKPAAPPPPPPPGGRRKRRKAVAVFSAEAPELRLGMYRGGGGGGGRALLPSFPEHVFETEARRWLGAEAARGAVAVMGGEDSAREPSYSGSNSGGRNSSGNAKRSRA